MRRPLLPALLALGLVAAALTSGGRAGAGTIAVRLRPNLAPLPTSQVEIRSVNGSKRLYLSFDTANTGTGPLEVRPLRQDCDDDGSTADDRTALQRIYGDTDGSGGYTEGSDAVARSVEAGCFTFHAIHGHWHFQDFARYRLLSLAGERLRSRSKVGFCMLDSYSVDGSLPGHPASPRYRGCPDLALQGISVGWADTYGVTTPGQFITVDGLATGGYCLVSTADPADRIVESDESDNVVRTRVRLGDRGASIRSRAC